MSDVRLHRFVIGVLATLTAITACREPATPSGLSPTLLGTNTFGLDLQEGFQGKEVRITVDGREVYKGSPMTRPQLGFADRVSGSATSIHPVLTLTMPSKGVIWTQQIDLSAGAVFGISVTETGTVQVLQQTTGFGYE